ncbi:hypothetical protein BN1723_020743, partial [Verticillium longisporum]
CGY